MIRELPRIDERRCSACGDCLPACPTDCLRIVGHVPVLTSARDCISCGVCGEVCPESAIALAPWAWQRS